VHLLPAVESLEVAEPSRLSRQPESAQRLGCPSGHAGGWSCGICCGSSGLSFIHVLFHNRRNQTVDIDANRQRVNTSIGVASLAIRRAIGERTSSPPLSALDIFDFPGGINARSVASNPAISCSTPSPTPGTCSTPRCTTPAADHTARAVAARGTTGLQKWKSSAQGVRGPSLD
jgi:hypothetical protein